MKKKKQYLYTLKTREFFDIGLKLYFYVNEITDCFTPLHQSSKRFATLFLYDCFQNMASFENAGSYFTNILYITNKFHKKNMVCLNLGPSLHK